MTSNSQDGILKPGTLFRSLRISALLGVGGMGYAYLATHPVLKSLFIIKILKESSEQNMFKEAHLTARIVSPNVVSILDAGIEQGMPFLVQQYVDGIDVDIVVNALSQMGRRLPLGVGCGIIAGIASGLHAVHQAGVLHCDVKPNNVFIRGDGTAVLGDFGLALDRHNPLVKRYRRGTPLYKSPEQWTGSEISRSSDLYALGATAHFILTGQPPFVEKTSEALKIAHLYRPYQSPESLGPREAFAFSLVKKLLAKASTGRPSRADELCLMFRHLAIQNLMYLKMGPDTYRFGDLLVTLMAADVGNVEADVIVGSLDPSTFGCSEENNDVCFHAGDTIRQALFEKAPFHLGQIVWTDAGRLKSRKLAHAVSAYDGAVCIQRCVLSILLQAALDGANSVAFVPLGVTSGESSMEHAAQRMLESFLTVASWRFPWIRSIYVILSSADELDIWRSHLDLFTPDSLENCLSAFELATSLLSET